MPSGTNGPASSNPYTYNEYDTHPQNLSRRGPKVGVLRGGHRRPEKSPAVRSPPSASNPLSDASIAVSSLPFTFLWSQIVIIGAGVNGMTAAVFLRNFAHYDNFTIIERSSNFGGTWFVE